MSLISQMQADTVLILADWDVDIIISIPTINTDMPPVTTWSRPYDAFVGDWQPYTKEARGKIREPGIDQHYDVRIFAPYDIEAKIGDRAVKVSDESFVYIKKILPYEDHIELLATVNKSS